MPPHKTGYWVCWHGYFLLTLWTPWTKLPLFAGVSTPIQELPVEGFTSQVYLNTSLQSDLLHSLNVWTICLLTKQQTHLLLRNEQARKRDIFFSES